MASISSRRLANSLTWSFNFSHRSRTFAFSFTQTEHARRRRRQEPTPFSQTHNQQFARAFNTHSARHADPQSQPAAPSTQTNTGSNPTIQRSTSTFPPSSRPREPPPPTARNEAATSASSQATEPPIRDFTRGLSDAPANPTTDNGKQVDWTTSYHGLSNEAFSKEATDILMTPIDQNDIEIKPEGIIYLPEIKYRRILNRAFGPGAWGLAPRGETIVTAKSVTREYALLVHGRLTSTARGEQAYFDPEGIPTATEGCKSNALMRCCKDLGVASELWDPRYIRKFMKESARETWVEHQVTKRKKRITLRKDDEVRYPFREVKG